MAVLMAGFLVLLTSFWHPRASAAPAGEDRPIECVRYLLLDARVVDSTENAELTLGTVHKDPRNPLFGEDKPWEPRFDNVYANVVYDEEDGGVSRMYLKKTMEQEGGEVKHVCRRKWLPCAPN